MKLNGKIAIITGGSQGVGLAAAHLFVKEGAKVVIASRNEKIGNAAAVSITADGKEAMFVACDVSKTKDCERVVNKTIDVFGGIDILIHNAGVVFLDTTVVNTTEAVWNETIDINLTGAFLMSKYTIPNMLKAGKGAVVNVSSIYGIVGGNGAAPYCASKGGMVLLTKAMALDHAKQNIRVNCIYPGSIDSPMLKKEMEELGGDSLKLRQMFASKHPMNRISTPGEQANAILFLVSDDSSFITGAVLPVDGGRSTW